MAPGKRILASKALAFSSQTLDTSDGGLSSKRVRGETIGKNTTQMLKSNGGVKLFVPVPEHIGAPVGYNAPKFANELGFHIRHLAPLQFASWYKIPENTRESIIKVAKNKYDIEGYDTKPCVKAAIHEKCYHMYKNWHHNLYKNYLEKVDAGIDPYNAPYGHVSLEDWKYMIDNVWTTEEHKKKSKRNKENRSKLAYNHTMGSRSFPAAMYIEAMENKGNYPHIVDFFAKSHWSEKKNDWINPVCGKLHEEMSQLRNEALESEEPISEEQISQQILGKRSGYLKGFGRGPKPSSSVRGITESYAHAQSQIHTLLSEVDNLKELVQTQQSTIEMQQATIEIQQGTLCEQGKKFEEMDKMMKVQMDFIMMRWGDGGGSSFGGRNSSPSS